MHLSPSLVLLAALAGAPGAAHAAGVPVFDGSRDCRAAAALDQVDRRTEGDCAADERDARAKLVRRWGEFADADRRFCTQETRTGGPPSYVDLLVCLQIAKGNTDDRRRESRERR
ncbi:hypothetical protein [Salinarimonas soli]|uniref:Lysozyme inhibitor LprI N-terminal domain-containing protein n=1 Tax=Salinarimonas soli TaxID=1638099 RepID=A0A5B2VCX1_9HYPH|nr:hypothetical protein [Salinarimonas soli]KAA2236595.1 hypothetical protein F0L46_14075 [Salinarimonas soli]